MTCACGDSLCPRQKATPDPAVLSNPAAFLPREHATDGDDCWCNPMTDGVERVDPIEPWLERAEDLVVAKRLNDLLMNNAGGSTVGNDLTAALEAVAKRIRKREQNEPEATPSVPCPCGMSDDGPWHTEPPTPICRPDPGPARETSRCLHHSVGQWIGGPMVDKGYPWPITKKGESE